MVVIRAVAFCRQRGCHAGRPSHAISSQGAAESPPAGDRARRRAAARGAGPSQPRTSPCEGVRWRVAHQA
jgi:hypothetical protein